MLSEAYRVAKSLEAAGIEPAATAGDVRIPGATSGSWAYVLLDAEGLTSGVRAIDPEDAKGLWTIMEGNQNSFPVVRLKRPLIILPAEHPVWAALAEASRKKESDVAICNALLAHLEPERAESPDPELWKRLREKKVDDVKTRAESTMPDVVDLCARFLLSADDPATFSRKLAAQTLQELREGKTEVARFARDLLVGKEPKKDKHETSVQLALDLGGGRSIYSSDNRRAISAAKSRGVKKATASVCAYAGGCDDPQDESFPKVRVPVLGRDYPLLSMFSEAQCNVRYGLTDERIVPVSKETVSAAHGALSHVLAPEFEDAVWRAVASGQYERKDGRTLEKRDLLVMFLEDNGKPVRSAFLASNPKKTDYYEETRSVIDALKGVAQKNPAKRLDLFILRAVSKGQAQAVYAERPLVTEVIAGAEAWQARQRNRPSLVFDSRKKASPLVSPESAVRLLSEVWTEDASRANRAVGISLGEALDLLLQRPGRADDIAEAVLGLIATRTLPLLRKVAAELRTGGSPAGFDTATVRRAANLLALALSHQDRKKDDYMKEPAYLVGRLLGLSDKLHVQYCRVVRGGDIPPTLIGNGLLGTALESPVGAIATLADRLRIYLGWARSVDVPKDGGKKIAILTAKKTLSEFADVEAELGGRLPEGRTTEAMKALMLLGYLARTQADTDVSESEDENEENKDAE